MSAEVKNRRTCCNYIYYHIGHSMMPEKRGENMKANVKLEQLCSVFFRGLHLLSVNCLAFLWTGKLVGLVSHFSLECHLLLG